MQKDWYKSKTIWTSLVGLVVAMLVAFEVIDTATGAKLGGMILPLLFLFLRVSDTAIGSGSSGEPPPCDDGNCGFTTKAD